ncbi:MAG: polysaccharide deacetylase family protein, partial [Thermodesulfobacteriota bacterium]
MKIVTSWDDGHKLDLKIVELLKKYKLPGIFYISNVDLGFGLKKLIEISEDFEIGGHTISHPEDLKRLTYTQLCEEICYNKKWLEDITGKPIKSFCYPGGRYNEETVRVVKECGYENARTTVILNTDLPEDPYRVQGTIHFSKRREYNGKSPLEVAVKQFELAKSKPNGYFHIWGHSLEIEKYGLWDDLEKLFKIMARYIH